eukprot:6616810-Lingulodinium_polyedra.AAC.1
MCVRWCDLVLTVSVRGELAIERNSKSNTTPIAWLVERWQLGAYAFGRAARWQQLGLTATAASSAAAQL